MGFKCKNITFMVHLIYTVLHTNIFLLVILKLQKPRKLLLLFSELYTYTTNLVLQFHDC
jgi:hypothetical protein